MSLPAFPTAPIYDFGRSKERRSPLFSREVAVLIYAILAVSIIVSGIALYNVNHAMQYEENRADKSQEAVDRLKRTRNMLTAMLVVECVTVALGIADYYM